MKGAIAATEGEHDRRAHLLIGLLIVAGVVARLLVARSPGFPSDVGTFMAWAERLAAIGPGRFYEPGYSQTMLSAGYQLRQGSWTATHLLKFRRKRGGPASKAQHCRSMNFRNWRIFSARAWRVAYAALKVRWWTVEH